MCICKLCKIIKKKFLPLVLIFFISLIIVLPFFFWAMYHEHTVNYTNVVGHNYESIIDDYTLWYYLCLVILTFVLACIAWIQFSNVNESLNRKILLQIDQRWHSKEIIKARRVIHKIFLEKSKEVEEIEDKKHKEEMLRRSMGEEIIRLSEDEDSRKIKDFIYLLNFLDFMESIGYFYSQKYLDIVQINEFFGTSLKFNYDIFKPYIKRRRINHRENDLHREFENLHSDLKRQGTKSVKT